VLVVEEVEEDLRRLASDLHQNSMTYEEYLAQSGRTREEHQGRLAAQAAEQIRSVLALRKIAEQEGIAVTDADLDAEFARMRNDGLIAEDQYDEFRRDSRRRLQLANALSRQRLHDFLFANNTIVEVEQTTPPDPDASADAETE
jgi:trigger factor